MSVGDMAGSLAGPTGGNVGDIVTFTVTVTNNGPDAVHYLPAYLQWSEMYGNEFTNFEYVGDDRPGRCNFIGPGAYRLQCVDYATNPADNTIALEPPGASFTVHVQLRVLDTTAFTTICGGADTALAGLSEQTDPNPGNDGPCFSFRNGEPQPPPPSPPPPPAPGPTAPPYSLVASLPAATQYRLYSVETIPSCGLAPPVCPGSVDVASGSLPPGVAVEGSSLVGSPTTPGDYTFTLEAKPSTYQNFTTISQDYTVQVAPLRETAGATAPPVLLPHHSLTPGITNPAVRQTTIRSTICVSRWTSTVRPPVAFTNALKVKQMQQYGETGSPSSYEEDHLIPLELGGAPRDPKNLWPEPHSESKHSDPLETSLKRSVCAGSLTLAAARKQILTYKRTHG